MKTTIFAMVACASLLAACNRTDTTGSTAPGTQGAVGNPAATADIRTSSVPPITPSTSATEPPALPAPPDLPRGAGDAAPGATAATPPNGSAPSAASRATTTAQDTAANHPTGTMTKEEESTQMPKAGQANNYNSTAIEESRGQSPKRAQ